ncbi:PREDICTED: huntingtin-interacting protein 1 [Rhagoletis zephyria]|uniref:huntingtin-interacting protein 1 n=1 Tax=Rhagoletis zephyria TaxID=28612 RepID=UPI00081177D5|nr:PREDICTED: huntingtin-interacting protein 1 [Rhagoletis zephyria]XP_017470329.1 PREDICTED: huntingtin-interacting protein 1 [Rhagoletis zephyria]
MAPTYDKEMYNMSVSVNKALNPMEAPLKMKHARFIIITTHRVKEAKSLWMIFTRQPLMENRFTAWKFCHLLHKVLREGHTSAIKDSQTHKKMILEMGKLWGHLQDGVGNCIQAYSKLVVTKLEFHEKNVLFPGSLLIDFKEIEKAADDDINIYFQLCVEIFDYLDDILDVQSRVFASINAYRMSSMTPQGQCRLAPLITLIQDSNPLYDLCVRVMFKLHDKLPNDILTGHRDRFRELFFKIKVFYDNVRPLQYFSDLIQVPHLPESAPNFTSKVDFGSYVPPVMYVQPDPEPPMENLVDTSITQESAASTPTAAGPDLVDNAALQNTIRDYEYALQDVQTELVSCKQNYEMMEKNFERELKRLRNDIAGLTSELAHSKELCANMQAMKEALEQKLVETPILVQKATEEEQKAKTSEEKFNKLKAMYTQIRDEHINLLRQHGESTKNLNREKQTNAELKIEVETLTSKIDEIKGELENNEVIGAEKLALATQIETISRDYQKLQHEHEELRKEYQSFTTNKNSEISELTAKAVKLQTETAALIESESKVAQLEAQLNTVNGELAKKQVEHAVILDEFKRSLDLRDENLNELRKMHAKEILEKVENIKELETNLYALELNLKETNVLVADLETLQRTNTEQLHELLEQKNHLQEKFNESNTAYQSEVEAKRKSVEKYENRITALFKNVLKTMELVTEAKVNETNQPNFDKTIKLVGDMEELLEQADNAYEQFITDKLLVDDVTRKTILLGCVFVTLHEQCLLIYNTTTDIGKGEEIYNQINSAKEPLLTLFQQIKNSEDISKIRYSIADIKLKLSALNESVAQLNKASSKNIDLGDLVENELAEMDKAIEEAAEKFVELLSNARCKDDGIKLEVNEKILDACTFLMQCIKLLIRKAKALQEEIVSAGRGTTSIKEFYKRNSQWTEGLISAAKSVAKGANLLVEAANKAIVSESAQNFEIIVAAQEIAACTAQLVIASKVKAPKESQKLGDLTKASRDVSQATGQVVATVKDCNQSLEQLHEVDFTKLNSSQAKTMEMEIHVKVLELEQALQMQRLKLASFRRKHYQNSDD